MSLSNVDRFKRGFQAWNDDDYDAWIDQFDPDVEWSALMEVFRGHAGARQAWESFKGDMQLTVRFDDIRDLGESVLALGELTGTGRSTGLDVGGEVAQLFTFRNGKAIRVRDFPSHAEGLEAAGLTESGGGSQTAQAPPGRGATTMTHGNADLLPKAYAAYEQGGLDALAEYWHPEITWRAAEGALDDVGLMEGAGALRRYYEGWEETFDAIRMEVDEVVDAGDQVVAFVRGIGRMKGSESEIDIRYAMVVSFRDGKIASGREYFTREEALEAAGLDAGG